ncbi:MAG: glucokinase [Holophagales bacterium]|nr:glucokinase [Holophagales bacterium]
MEILRSDILSGDIGGTNVRLAILRSRPSGGFEKVDSMRFSSAEVPSLNEAIARFLHTHDARPERAAFGAAGPVIGGEWNGTNLSWKLSLPELTRTLGFREVALLNDLEAMAWGIPLLDSDALECLQKGEPRAGNQALGAAGTGFGHAGLFWDGRMHRPFASEGGHTDFGPRNELEVELLRFLWRRYRGRASWERIVSGMGVANLFDFFVERGGEPADGLRDLVGAGDKAAAEISRAALEERCEVAVRALDLFVQLYGSAMGDFALHTLAVGGVFLGGGITSRILEKLRGPAFREAFRAKDRMGELLEAMPIHAVLDGEQAALFGAARALEVATAG